MPLPESKKEDVFCGTIESITDDLVTVRAITGLILRRFSDLHLRHVKHVHQVRDGLRAVLERVVVMQDTAETEAYTYLDEIKDRLHTQLEGIDAWLGIMENKKEEGKTDG